MFRARRARNIEGFGAPRLARCPKTLLIRTDVGVSIAMTFLSASLIALCASVRTKCFVGTPAQWGFPQNTFDIMGA